jgi:hypothetical protein
MKENALHHSIYCLLIDLVDTFPQENQIWELTNILVDKAKTYSQDVLDENKRLKSLITINNTN